VDFYGVAPQVQWLGATDLQFPYVSSHLYYILFEIFKNSMRAVVENHNGQNLPPIQLVLAEGGEDISLKISDRGGGISRKGKRRIRIFST
jgi:pyruvate dehydrogenase kinase 2/3/4